MKLISKVLHTDFIVIGGGVAGLRAAIELASAGRVLVVTKDRPSESSTEYAQGGVAVALGEEDEVSIHYRDTLRAGDGLCRSEAVRVLVEEGPKEIEALMAWGAQFDREGMELVFAHEAAHSRRRVLRAKGDSTGHEILRTLVRQARDHRDITRLSHACTLDLLMEGNICRGVLLVHGGELTACYGRAVILATGGAGQLYSRTTNPTVATGDGMAMAFRAGAVMEDMEMVQFHPTSLYVPGAPQFLLSEAMRGEGGVLLNARGRRFMDDYHPSAELAPRDVVTRAILSQMIRTKSKHVFLDLTHLPPSFIRKRFPRIYATCLGFDVDITEEPIPVSPAAHYIMGGVKTTVVGRTSLAGLFAAGEVACTGVHGANRLASNSLLEGLVFGARAGQSAAEYGAQVSRPSRGPRVSLDDPVHPAEVAAKIRIDLRRVMWDKVGIIRCAKSLTQACRKLDEWEAYRSGPAVSRADVELKNMLDLARLIQTAALLRENSVGAHYRSDFKEKDAGWRRHIRLSKATPGL